MRMILLTITLTAILGTILYQVKTGIDARESQLLTLEHEISAAEREISVLEAEWAFLSRPERVLDLSGRLLEMQPISENRILPLDAIPMRIMPSFNDQIADIGVITLLPPKENETDLRRIAPRRIAPRRIAPRRIDSGQLTNISANAGLSGQNIEGGDKR
jgi:hypothetical protein